MKLGCFVGGFALVLIASAPSPAQDAKPKISDPKLREAVAKLEEALNKYSDGDPDPYIACWSKREDALQMGPSGGYDGKGIAEIGRQAKFIAPRFKGRGYKFTFEYVSVVETKELAYVVSIDRRTAPSAEKQEGRTVAFRTTNVFRLEDGEWKLVLNHCDSRVNSLSDGYLKPASLRVQHPNCSHAFFTSDGRLLITTSRDSSRRFGSPFTIHVWEAATGKPIADPIHMTDAMFQNPIVTPDNKYLVIRYTVGAEITNREHRVEFRSFENLNQAGVVVNLSVVNATVGFSSSGHMLSATAPLTRGIPPQTTTLQLWEIPTGKAIGDSWAVNTYVHGIAFRKGDTQVFLSTSSGAARNSGTVQCFDLAQGRPVGDPWPTGNVKLVLGPDDKYALTQARNVVTGEAGPKGTVRRWEVASGKAIGDPIRPERTAPTMAPLQRDLREWSAIHADARLAAATTNDRTVQVFDMEAGQPLGTPLKHVEPVYYIQFSFDGRRLLTASAAFGRSDGCWLWDVASGQRLARLRVDGELVSAAFHPDGKSVIAVNDRGEVSAWDLPKQE
jgi:WD40 repeat protein